MARIVTTAGRVAVVLVGIAIAAAAGWVLFVVLPDTLAELLGVLLVLVAVGVGARSAGRLSARLFPDYNVAEVAVEGPITRDGRGMLPTRPGGTPADDIVEQIDNADADDNAEALLVKLNTPGGEVVPSDDIRRAAAAFDGPTIAYATDLCASGGYWIASGCDELWARDASIVGSIGVIMSQVNASDLADRVGLTYEGFTAGEYKDAGMALKEMTDDDREYFQGLTDEIYDQFVERVVEGRDLEDGTVRDTEARIYLGEEALDLGLVDELGAREDVEDALESAFDEPVSVREFEPSHGLGERLRGGAATVAHALGAGVASAVVGDDAQAIELR